MKNWGPGFLLVSAMIVSGLSTPASAQTATSKDARGDVRPAALDWTHLTVTNTSAAITTRMTFTNLPKGGVRYKTFGLLRFRASVTLEAYDVANWRHYYVSASRKRARTKLSLGYQDENGYATVKCPGMAARWAAGKKSFIEVMVPRSCLELSQTVAASAGSFLDIEGDAPRDVSEEKILVPQD